MPPAHGRPLLPVLLLLPLALSLSLTGAHSASWGRRAASVADEEPKPSPVRPAAAETAGAGPALLLRRQARATPALRAVRSAEIFPRDLNLKDKFIKHFTDYKRCARLLTRLAVSPLCTQT
ncbi:ALK and LTK ligand 1 isoform X2 [Loxodonta africana]|uniref:ALK and LTK ligand 1 isoform X2 n=1 Tax=Loxodonta africana TaxID=9785 RepID=UPI0030CB0D77